MCVWELVCVEDELMRYSTYIDVGACYIFLCELKYALYMFMKVFVILWPLSHIQKFTSILRYTATSRDSPTQTTKANSIHRAIDSTDGSANNTPHSVVTHSPDFLLIGNNGNTSEKYNLSNRNSTNICVTLRVLYNFRNWQRNSVLDYWAPLFQYCIADNF